MPTFSVIIPVYNGSQSVRACVESVLGQSFSDLEILCVEDRSPDDSLEVLRRLAADDRRVRVLQQPENRGCARARRRGVLESCGDYVLFADQDDAYLPGALERMHAFLKRNPVDMLAYDVEVKGTDGADELETFNLTGWINSSVDSLSGDDILRGCFIENRFGYSIWNKAYRGEMARKGFGLMEDIPIPLGEDNYASFVLAYLARSFRALRGRPLYRYHYGAGFTGHATMSLAGWKRTISLVVAAEAIRRFLEGQHALDAYSEEYRAARSHMLVYAFDRYSLELPHELREDALRMALDLWPYPELLRAAADRAPSALPLLVDLHFGDAAQAAETKCWVKRASERLCELESERHAVLREADGIRIGYERSAAYRRGRKIASLFGRP